MLCVKYTSDYEHNRDISISTATRQSGVCFPIQKHIVLKIRKNGILNYEKITQAFDFTKDVVTGFTFGNGK